MAIFTMSEEDRAAAIAKNKAKKAASLKARQEQAKQDAILRTARCVCPDCGVSGRGGSYPFMDVSLPKNFKKGNIIRVLCFNCD